MDEFLVRGLPHSEAHNPALIGWQQRRLMMYRVGGAGSAELFLGELDGNFQPAGKFYKVFIPGEEDCQDPRFFIYRNQLHFSYVVRRKERQFTGIGIVNDDLTVRDCRVIEINGSRTTEKNWIFFPHGDDDLYFTYSMSNGVHQVYRLTDDGCEFAFRTPYLDPWKWGQARGGTELITHNGLSYGFFHGTAFNDGGVERRYYMGAYAVSPEPPFQIVKMSCNPLYTPPEDRLHPATKISPARIVANVFPAGLVLEGDNWLVCAGYNNHAIKIFKISHSELESNLISTEPGNRNPGSAASGHHSSEGNRQLDVHFPSHDRCWMQPLEIAGKLVKQGEIVFAHDHFLGCIPQSLPYFRLTHERLRDGKTWLILHKDDSEILSLETLRRMRKKFTVVFANEVFVVFTNRTQRGLKMDFNPGHVQALWQKVDRREERVAKQRKLPGVNNSRGGNPQAAIRLNVAILTHNALEFTQRCVASLERFATGPYKLFIVDNLSTDGTRDWLTQFHEPYFHYELSPVNLGVPAGRNRLIELMLPHLPPDGFAIFFDNDAEMTGLWQEPFLEFFGDHPEAGIAGKHGHKIIVAGDTRELEPPPRQAAAPVDTLSGWAFWVRAATLKQVGGFDESLGLFWHEDDDYDIRAIAAGWEVYAVPEAPIYHHQNKSGAAISGIAKGGSPDNLRYLVQKWRNMGVVDQNGRIIHRPGAGNKQVIGIKSIPLKEDATMSEERARQIKLFYHFPKHDPYWMQTLEAARKCIQRNDSVFAPDLFIEFFPNTLPYLLINRENLAKTDWLILHKGLAGKIDLEALRLARQKFIPIFANEVYVILSNKTSRRVSKFDPVHVRALWGIIDELEGATPPKAANVQAPGFAAVITTYNRPWALARTLPQLTNLGCPIVVVDDGSDSKFDVEYNKIRDQFAGANIQWINLPGNRGVPCAINTGVSYFLADPSIDWISYFQDDVDVHPEIFKHLAKVQDRVERPLLTGRYPPEHPIVAETDINGIHLLLCHSTSAQHLHAHRDYWTAVMPLPSFEVGLPKPHKISTCDWWIGSWAANSVCKTGRKIVCVPGLVSTFAIKPEDSTWDNQPVEDTGLLD